MITSAPFFLISLFIKRNANIIFSAFLNTRFSSNSKYLFLWFIENINARKSFFVINDDCLREKLNSDIGNYFIETKTIKGKVFALRASTWFISSLEMPVNGLFLKYKRTIIHLGHGTPLKNIGLLEKNISLLKKIYYDILQTNISYSIASSPFFQEIIASFLGIPSNRVLIAGQARNDQLLVHSESPFRNNENIDGSINILYAPTWRPSGNIALFPFEDFSSQLLSEFLIEKKVNIHIRVHPYVEEQIDKRLLEIGHVFLFPEGMYPEIMDSLNQFDMLITDYSSIYFDYLILNRPIIFIPYDYDRYKKEIGFTVLYHDFTPGYKVATQKDLLKAIGGLLQNDPHTSERDRLNSLCNVYQKDNCKEFASLLSEIGVL
ncbi:CDP-glycerol glycerophosphotransferase family protein [Treponema primitia]|uniref:CDP-glycerol glycerophosphotransferase family protein n=1 Tax=Treponema primitia TaxID=88058 RepID=UPI0018E17FC8|nr:CDP-glycerol glycerophosphotransferase family protein [Treponema primitia]